MTCSQLVLASGNTGKLAELSALLGPLGIEISSQSEFGVESPEETSQTFLDNALIKARYAAQIAGLPAIADDSGLCVDVLDGAPGVYSARYAGESASDEENLNKLLSVLEDVADTERSARFESVVVYVRDADDSEPVIGHGVWRGEILRARRGNGGFGYDPIFWVSELGCSAAELSASSKNDHSHRGQALRRLLGKLQGIPGGAG
ncbi:MAG: non-canonical purine NTP pyrophosphatase, RdgB/HAM1 family [Thiotrichales bacterium]|nr:non-canonical purine NTP pyrophosphatase, RdgB/HAM1 family [Thiotrichales bacterium]